MPNQDCLVINQLKESDGFHLPDFFDPRQSKKLAGPSPVREGLECASPLRIGQTDEFSAGSFKLARAQKARACAFRNRPGRQIESELQPMARYQPVPFRPASIPSWLAASLLVLFLLPSLAAGPVISEFMAGNQTSLLDEDGDASDWIELHNPTQERINLAGWFLTDQEDLPSKWRFPDRFIEPGNFLLVFASGKNRVSPGPLHTNFRLEANGEYLALFPPDQEAAASAFSPRFPPQEADISFGIPMGASIRDLLPGSPVWLLLPSSADELPGSWSEFGANPGSGWIETTGFGLGYDNTPAGSEPGVNLAQEGIASQSTTSSAFGAANAIDGDPATFTHTESYDTASTWWIDLGASTEISRVVLRNREDCCGSRFRDLTVNLLATDGKTVTWTSGLLNPENSLGSPASLTLDFFALNVGAIEARMVQVVRTPDPDLSGSDGVGNPDEAGVLSLGEVEIYGVGSVSYGPLIRSDLAATMRGRNSSAFVRVPFTLEDSEDVTSLTLQLRFDDGVAVHLNGQEISALNTPLSPAWNAAATAKRDKTAALAPMLIDLLPSRFLWRAGVNWLAFQGLNASSDDSEFLLDAQLLAGTGGPRGGAYLEQPTPGASNNTAWNLGRVADTKFSVNRGFVQAPFDLVLSTATPDARIRYTLDGSEPTASEGLVYSAPLRINRTTSIRAAAFKPDYRPTDVDTHTYIFLVDVVAQSANPPGFPTTWAGVSADYGMDPRITREPTSADRMNESLQALPSLAITTPNDNLFGSSRGIYANPERSGIDWERPASFEWINADGSSGFQMDCGIRIQGGYFRQRHVTQKHSLRLLFKKAYGPGRLREDLFGEFGAAQEFDTLVLRAGANDGYAWNDARDTEQFTRDEFGRRCLLAMGQPSPRGQFAHLYLNGLYWGLYNLTERPAEDFSATYLGGEPEEWDAVNSGEIKSGSLEAWNIFIASVRNVTTLADYQRLKGLNPDGTRNSALPEYFDATNYIDYMLVNIWGGNWDWPNKNFWFGRHRGGLAGGFKFYLWDFENTMGNNRGRSPLDMVSPRSDIADSWVGEPHTRLKLINEYKIEFADRVQRHFFNGGTLAPESLIERYRELADHVEPAIIAETARWGDDNWPTPQDLADWQRERDWILGVYLPQRTGVVLAQLRSAGLFPKTAAPVIEPPGGSLASSTPIVLSTSASELFYTTNGLDPRLPGGAVRPEAIRVFLEAGGNPAPDPELIRSGDAWKYLADGTDPGENWRELNAADDAWGSGNSPLGYGDGDEATDVGFVDVDPGSAGAQRNAATFFRKTFEVNPSSLFESLELWLIYDDAAAVYLNGTEVLRTDNLPPNGRFDTYATAQSSDNAIAIRNDLPGSLLRPGQNIVAVQIHQNHAGSSDISFDLALTGVAAPSGIVNTSGPLFVAGPAWIRARARQGTEWSALNEASFVPDLVAATSSHLVISEFCYRPADSATPAERSVTSDRDDFEFIEVMNVSTQSVDLTGVRFTVGILFNFPDGTVLEPGERVMAVRNRSAFEARYGSAMSIAGEYQGNLTNDGEEIVLQDAAGRDIRRLRYQDRAPWPPSADENGYSVVLKRPGAASDLNDPAQWRASVRPGGNPGGTDSSVFAGSPEADNDANGQADLFDYAFGTLLSDPNTGIAVSVQPFQANGEVTHHFVITFPRNLAADDAWVNLESAADPAGPWQPGDFTLFSEQRSDAALLWQSFRLNSPIHSGAAFVRLSVSLVR